MRHGKGTYIFANGDTYEGDFKENKMHGEGKYTWTSGRFYEGLFEDGKIVNSEEANTETAQ